MIDDQLGNCVRLLVALHENLAPDSDAADKIRDDMDLRWRCLTPEDMVIVDTLSEALYALAERSK